MRIQGNYSINYRIPQNTSAITPNSSVPAPSAGSNTPDIATAPAAPVSGSEVQVNTDGDTYEKTIKDSNQECQTCKNRKYQDGSDEMVSFKSPTHVSPQAAAGAVMAHEQEHVANAYNKAEEDNGEVIQASVQIHTGICPECGRTYVAGGTTTTQIMYTNESNPYQQERKSQDAGRYSGMNVDLAT